MNRSKETGVSLVEFSLVTLLIAMVAIASISSLRNRSEAYLWLVTLFIVSPETPLPNGMIRTDVWAPRSAFEVFGGFTIPQPWCRVVLISGNSLDLTTENLGIVTPSNITECANTPP